MDRWIDDVARGLARGISRRTLIRVLASAIGGLTLGSAISREGPSGSNGEANAAPDLQTCVPDGGRCVGPPTTGGGCCSGVCGPGRICAAATATPPATDTPTATITPTATNTPTATPTAACRANGEPCGPGNGSLCCSGLCGQMHRCVPVATETPTETPTASATTTPGTCRPNGDFCEGPPGPNTTCCSGFCGASPKGCRNCTSASDCSSGLICDTTINGGTCVVPTGATSTPTATETPTQTPTTPPVVCRPNGDTCQGVPGPNSSCCSGFCGTQPKQCRACTQSSDCASGQVCDPTLDGGTCVVPTPTSTPTETPTATPT
jgi:hypothetical protein